MALKPHQLWLDDLLDLLVEEFVSRVAVAEAAAAVPLASDELRAQPIAPVPTSAAGCSVGQA